MPPTSKGPSNQLRRGATGRVFSTRGTWCRRGRRYRASHCGTAQAQPCVSILLIPCFRVLVDLSFPPKSKLLLCPLPCYTPCSTHHLPFSLSGIQTFSAAKRLNGLRRIDFDPTGETNSTSLKYSLQTGHLDLNTCLPVQPCALCTALARPWPFLALFVPGGVKFVAGHFFGASESDVASFGETRMLWPSRKSIAGQHACGRGTLAS